MNEIQKHSSVFMKKNMSFTIENFNIDNVNFSMPGKPNDHGGSVINVTYKQENGAERPAGMYLTEDVHCSPLKENPDKPNHFGTGFAVTDPRLREIFREITEKAFQFALDNASADNMPDAYENFESVEMMKKMMKYPKGLISDIYLKNPNTGKKTKKVDPNAIPRCYMNLIQDKSGDTIYTKAFSAEALNAHIRKACDAGKDKKQNYEISMSKLIKKGKGFKALVEMSFSSIYVSDIHFIFRNSLSTFYVTEFTSMESQATKKLAEHFENTGRTFKSLGDVEDEDLGEAMAEESMKEDMEDEVEIGE